MPPLRPGKRLTRTKNSPIELMNSKGAASSHLRKDRSRPGSAAGSKKRENYSRESMTKKNSQNQRSSQGSAASTGRTSSREGKGGNESRSAREKNARNSSRRTSLLKNSHAQQKKGGRPASSSPPLSSRKKETPNHSESPPKSTIRGKYRGKTQDPRDKIKPKSKMLKDAQDQIALLQTQLEAAQQAETSFLCQREIDTLHLTLQEHASNWEEEKKRIYEAFQREIEKKNTIIRGQEEGYKIEKSSYLHSIDILMNSFAQERQKREEEAVRHLVQLTNLQSQEEWLENALVGMRDKKWLNYASDESQEEYNRLFKLYGSYFTSISATKEDGLIALWNALGKTAGWRRSIRPAQLQLLLSRFSCRQLTFRVSHEHHLDLGGAMIAVEEVGSFFSALLSRIGSLAHLAILDSPVSPIVWEDFPTTLVVEVEEGTVEEEKVKQEGCGKENSTTDANVLAHSSSDQSSDVYENENIAKKMNRSDLHEGQDGTATAKKEKVLSQPFPKLLSLSLWHTKVLAHDLVQLVRLIPSLQRCGFQTIVNGISVHEKCLVLQNMSLDELMKLCHGKLWVWGRLIADVSDIIV